MICVRGDDTKEAGIKQFWTDDYKIFDKIYGKTSDKDLYGATLPPPIRFDVPKSFETAASDKNERYLTYDRNILDSEIPFDFSDRYAKIFSKSNSGKKKTSLQFVSLGDFKPISKSNDPETYNYLKNLEKKAKKKETSKHRPFSDSEEEEAYKSIQDILDAHEANKEGSRDSSEELPVKKKKEERRTRNRSKVRFINNNSIKSRCIAGRCRSPVRSRPYLKIKRYRYTTR